MGGHTGGKPILLVFTDGTKLEIMPISPRDYASWCFGINIALHIKDGNLSPNDRNKNVWMQPWHPHIEIDSDAEPLSSRVAKSGGTPVRYKK